MKRKPVVSHKHLPVPARVKWEKVDKVIYLNLTEARLQVLMKDIHQMPASIVTKRVNCILIECAVMASPPPPKRKRQSKFKWHPSLSHAARKAQECYRQLKGLHHDSSKYDTGKATLKVAKKLLRKAQHQLAASHRKKTIISIIDACRDG